ncbi:MAG: iron-sulfur cluster assembly accessory protein [Bacteroidia bacterium]|nr:iron-sulfur cluster assembly accessory protein [Bacteroidia bacterium]MDW8134186.1 iron-sulfur cluster assembly accessory protein [Bacteroidia bacterium]
MHIILTPSAVTELQRLLQENSSAAGIRLKVEAGGCAGLTYKLEIVETPKPTESRIEIEGIPLYVNPDHALFLEGIEIDYPTGLAARGFVFRNPQAKSTCGCGNSFSI